MNKNAFYKVYLAQVFAYNDSPLIIRSSDKLLEFLDDAIKPEYSPYKKILVIKHENDTDSTILFYSGRYIEFENFKEKYKPKQKILKR